VTGRIKIDKHYFQGHQLFLTHLLSTVCIVRELKLNNGHEYNVDVRICHSRLL